MNPSHPPVQRSENSKLDESDQIDLFELIGVVIKMRHSLFLGALLGLLISLFFVNFVSKKSFLTKVSVTVDVASLPAMTDSKKVVEAYMGALASPEIAVVAFQRILKESPAFANQMAANRHDLNDLVSDQTVGDKPSEVPLRLMPSTSAQDYILQANLKERGLGKEAGKILLAALNDAASQFNGRALQIHTENGRKSVAQATELLAAAQSHSAKKDGTQRIDLNQVNFELARVEYQLGKLGRGLPSFEKFVFSDLSPSVVVPLNSLNHDSTVDAGSASLGASSQPILDVSRAVRMIAALESDSRLSAKQADEFKATLTKLQTRFASTWSQLSSETAASKWAQAGLYDSMARSFIPIDRANLYLPLFRFNDQLFSSDLASRSFEIPSSSRKILVLGATLAGLFLGGFIGGLRLFISNNKSRFRSLLRPNGGV